MTQFEKETKDGRTKTSVQPLLFEEKVKEMLLQEMKEELLQEKQKKC